MKRLVLITLLLVITSIYAQGQKDVILQIDDEQVTLEEFKRIYFKNNKDSALTKESLKSTWNYSSISSSRCMKQKHWIFISKINS